MTVFTKVCVESVQHASSDCKDGGGGLYESERKNPATAASESCRVQERNPSSVWPLVASCSFLLRRNKSVNLRNGEK